MSLGISLALLGQICLAISLVTDKVLIGQKEKTGRILSYVFWIGVLNFVGLFLAPFGFVLPSLQTILLSLLAAAIFLASLAVYYTALARGGASSTLPIIGGFAPIATYFIAGFFILTPLNIADKIAFALLTAGGFLLFLSEKIDLKKIFLWIISAAVLVGFSDIFQKLAFNTTNFVTGFVLMKFFTGIIALGLLAIPVFRKQIFSSSAGTSHKFRLSYFLNRILSGAASFMIFYGIALTPQPALIEALSGVRYAAVFLIAFILSKIKPSWLKENFHGWSFAGKIVATILIFAGLLGLGLQKYYETKPIPDAKDITWGVTFSEQMSKRFGLNWKDNLSAIITDLKPKAIRLIAYWDDIEAVKGKFDYSDLDWQMDEAQKTGIPTILVVGQRVPRWPECHFPAWADPNKEPDAVHAELMNFVANTVTRYKDYSNLAYWQVENEPFLIFGECPKADANLLISEIAKVKEIDPKAKIFLTDGGEFGDWYRASKLADVFGPTLYRKVNTRLFGYITWPLTPQIYPLRRDITRALTGKKDQEFVISELGLEPWMVKQIYEVSSTTQFSFFNETDFKNAVSFARQTGYTTIYTWGAEWWYWLKTTQDYPSFWNMAKELFRN